jgi:hypothetical protein
MSTLTRISGLLAALGAAGLVVGLSLSPGVVASFSETATAGAGISVASSLDCDGDGSGINCAKKPELESTSQADDGSGGHDAEGDNPTATFGITEGSPLPKEEPALASEPPGATLTIELTAKGGSDVDTVVGTGGPSGAVVWTVPAAWDLSESTWATIYDYAATNNLVVAKVSVVDQG